MIEAPHPHSLLVVDYHEPSENDLCVTIVEAHVAAEAVDTFVGPAHPIVPTAHSRVFRVSWFNYVAFCFRNESYAVDEGEPRVGGLGTKQNSRFRDHVADTTWATDDFPGQLVHWFLNTEGHCLDVIAVDQPEIAEVSALEAGTIIASCREPRVLVRKTR